MNTERNCQSCESYKDGYCEVLELKPCYPQKGCEYFSRRDKESIDKSNLELICEKLSAENDDLRDQLAMRDRFMTDVINRRVVLNKILALWNSNGDKDYCMESLRDFVTELQPAIPQQKCEDIAKAFQFGMALGFGELYDEMDKVLEEVKRAATPKPKTGWIPVSERLPEDNTKVLATLDATYKEKVLITWYQDKEHGFLCGLVKAWMPLPEPYKAESEGD